MNIGGDFFFNKTQKKRKKKKKKTFKRKKKERKWTDTNYPYRDVTKGEAIKDFRKVLSNFYAKEKVDGVRPPLFELDGKKWASVEHYYHANKFKKNNKDYYDKFALGSGSEWEDEPLKALGAGGKGGNVREKNPETKKSKIIYKRPKEIVMDEDFFDGKNREMVMERGQQAKYEQDEFCKKVLLATKDAKLSHFVPRKPRGQNLVTFYDTMRIRQKLKKKN